MIAPGKSPLLSVVQCVARALFALALPGTREGGCLHTSQVPLSPHSAQSGALSCSSTPVS